MSLLQGIDCGQYNITHTILFSAIAVPVLICLSVIQWSLQNLTLVVHYKLSRAGSIQPSPHML